MRVAEDDIRMAQARMAMVEEQIAARGVRNDRVLDAMRRVPRHRFVPAAYRAQAHGDYPLPIGQGQTISQPYIVAFMAQAMDLGGDERVLEVGCGSGYMAAVLSLLAREVCALELDPELCKGARGLLADLGRSNIDLRVGDGRLGWPEGGAFDAIAVSCATPMVPEALWSQLREGGRLVLPLGPPGGVQILARITRTSQGSQHEDLLAVSFVPLR